VIVRSEPIPFFVVFSSSAVVVTEQPYRAIDNDYRRLKRTEMSTCDPTLCSHVDMTERWWLRETTLLAATETPRSGHLACLSLGRRIRLTHAAPGAPIRPWVCLSVGWSVAFSVMYWRRRSGCIIALPAAFRRKHHHLFACWKLLLQTAAFGGRKK